MILLYARIWQSKPNVSISSIHQHTTEAHITPNLHLEKLNPNIDLTGFSVLMHLGQQTNEQTEQKKGWMVMVA